MFALIGFGVVVLLLIFAAGQPYPQSWYRRFGD